MGNHYFKAAIECLTEHALLGGDNIGWGEITSLRVKAAAARLRVSMRRYGIKYGVNRDNLYAYEARSASALLAQFAEHPASKEFDREETNHDARAGGTDPCSD